MRISSVLCFLCAALILTAACCKGTEPLLAEATGNKALTSDSIKDKQNQISKAEKEKESLKGSLTDLKKVKKELEKKKKNLASYVAELDNTLSEIEQNIFVYEISVHFVFFAPLDILDRQLIFFYNGIRDIVNVKGI